ncbi:FHA domain-containing protein [Streptomyces lydicus]|nr:FHA domain-containing protein [Streptomyces lydicus]
MGRSADADVPLDDPDVSRLHCAVTVEPDGAVYVADLRSTNGTAVDGTGLDEQPAPLRPGALLRIGESTLRVQSAPGSPDPALQTAPDGEGHLRITPGPDGTYAPSGPAAYPPDPGTPPRPPRTGPRTPPRPGATARRDTPARHADPGHRRATGDRAARRGAALRRRPPSWSPAPAEAGRPAWSQPPSADHGYASHTPRPVPGRRHLPRLRARPRPRRRRPRGTHPRRPGRRDGPHPRRRAAAGPGRRATRGTRRRSTLQGGRRGGLGAWARRLAGGRPATDHPDGPSPTPTNRPAATLPTPAPPAAGGGHRPYGTADHERWPDAATVLLTALGPGTRLWERGPDHPDALTVRLGTASRSGGRAAVPVTVELRRAGSLGLAGPRARLTGLVRSAVAQLAALHSPGTLDIVLISTDRARSTEERIADWSWLGWLPHVRPGHGQDCRLLLAYDKEQATARAAELVRRLDDGPLGPGWPSAERAEVSSPPPVTTARTPC